MYCPNCGAQTEESAKFCPNCGAPIAAPAPAPEPEPAPVFEQPAAPAVQSEPLTAEKPLLVPAILAAIAAAMLVVSYFVAIWNDVKYPDSVPMRYVAQNLCVSMFPIAAAVFTFLFCRVQHPKGKTSLFGIACLSIAAAYGLSLSFDILNAVLAVAGRRAANSIAAVLSGIGTASVLLSLAVVVLFLIQAIFAFRGKINKRVGVAGAILLLVCRASSASSLFIGLSSLTSIGKENALVVLNQIPSVLLAIALLLVAVLRRPTAENR